MAPRGPKPNFERIKLVCEMRHNGRKYREIAQAIGISRQRVEQIYWSAVNIWKERVLAMGVNPSALKGHRARRKYTLCIACGKEAREVLGAEGIPPEEQIH